MWIKKKVRTTIANNSEIQNHNSFLTSLRLSHFHCKWLEKEMATHSNNLACEIPWTEKPGGLQSIGSQSIRHNWATENTLQMTVSFTLLGCLTGQSCAGTRDPTLPVQPQREVSSHLQDPLGFLGCLRTSYAAWISRKCLWASSIWCQLWSGCQVFTSSRYLPCISSFVAPSERPKALGKQKLTN